MKKMNELRTKIIEKAIECNKSIEETKEYLKLLERTDHYATMEVKIGTFADFTDNYKTICARCSELGIKTIGDLVRFGGRKFREDKNVGVKTAAIISDTLQEYFDIDNWFSKECEL